MEVSEMMTLDLSADSERKFREMAAQLSLSPEAYVELLLSNDELSRDAAQFSPPEELTVEEFDRILDEMSEGLPPLPSVSGNLSREDIYYDHD
jgi:hypothetical protein